MAVSYGIVNAFNPAADDWTIYEEKLQFYFSTNGIMDAARSVLLTVCGDSTFKLLRSLVPDGNLHADTASLVELLNAHHANKKFTIAHQYKFNTCSRMRGQSCLRRFTAGACASFQVFLKRTT